MKLKIMVCLVLLAIKLCADELPYLKLDTEKILFSKCDVCKKKMPTSITFVISFSWDLSGQKKHSEYSKYMEPYKKSSYRVCFPCILKALNVKPEIEN